MDVFIIEFNGHYPVGACAAVTAKSESVAKDLLMAELKIMDLLTKNKKSDLKVKKINTTKQTISIILNGDY